MYYTNCNCRPSCTVFAVVASIIIGIITAFLNFSTIITLTPAFLWVVFGIAVVYLGITAIAGTELSNNGTRRCVCTALTTLIIGIWGTILLSLILLAIEFAATSVIGAIFAGALLGFFTLLITSVTCIVKCIFRCSGE